MCSLHDINDNVRPSVALFKSKTPGRIWTKFGMDIMQLWSNLFKFRTTDSTNMAKERTCEVKSVLWPLTVTTTQ
jgi:hypothetical protein